MNWCDERYVRSYTRDTADFLALSFEAQGLLQLILRKLDRSGVLELGRHGKRAVAIAVGHASRWDVLEPALEELLADGCLVMDGNRLVMPNFVEAQEAVMSDRARQAESRARRRELREPVDAARNDSAESRIVDDNHVTERDTESRNVTESHAVSRDVTRGHAESRGVTPSVPCLPCLPSEEKNPTPALPGVVVLPPPKPRLELERVYAGYPRKEGRKKGLERLAKLIRTPADLELCIQAVELYARHCATTGQYLMHFDTWVGEWEDWAPDELGRPRNGAQALAPRNLNREEVAELERARRVVEGA